MSGIKWELKKEKNILKENLIKSLEVCNNELLLLGNNNSYLIGLQISKEDMKKKEEEYKNEDIDTEFEENQNSNCIII